MMHNIATLDHVLDVRGTAELLGTTESAIRARVARRCLPFRRLGGRLIFDREELLAFIRQLDGTDITEAIQNARARGR